MTSITKTIAETLRENKIAACICLLLIAITAIIYGQVAGYDFVGFDDPVFTTENDFVRNGFTWEGVKAVLTNPDYYCMQLSLLSHMLDCEIFGLAPGKHHLTNVLFHIANVILLFILLKKISGNLWPSTLAAFLFAVHPLNVESVAWIAERRNVLCTFFWFLTTLAYLRFVRYRTIPNYLVVILLFVLGLMSKAMLVTLPFTLLLLDFWPLRRIGRNDVSIRSAVMEKLPLLILSVAASGLTMLAVQNTGGAPGIGGLASIASLPLGFRITNAVVAYCAYLLKTIWPFGLSLNYPIQRSLSAWQIVPAFITLGAISVTAFFNRNKRPWLIVGWLWYLGTLVPVIGIIQLGHQSMADRYVYVPLVGIFVMVSWTIADWMHKPGRRIKHVLLAAILTLMAATAWIQTRYWENTITLYEHVIRISPNYSLAYYNLGMALNKQGRTKEALAYFLKALDIFPDFAEANLNVGLLLSQTDQKERAIAYYIKSIQKKPDLVEARFNLANLLLDTGRLKDAQKVYQGILSKQPKDPETLNALGRTYAKQGQIEQAIRFYLQAVQENPNCSKFQRNLGSAYERKNDLEKAAWYYSQAIRIDPTDVDAYNNLAVLLFRQGKHAEAFERFSEALKIEPDNPYTHYNLATSYARQNDVEKALHHFEKVLQIDRRFADAAQQYAELKKIMRQRNPDGIAGSAE